MRKQQQNLTSQKAEKCAKCHKTKLLLKFDQHHPQELKLRRQKQTWEQKDSEYTRMEKVMTLEPVQVIGEERLFGEKTGSNGEEGTTAGQSSREVVMKRKRWDLKLWPGNLADVQYKGRTHWPGGKDQVQNHL